MRYFTPRCLSRVYFPPPAGRGPWGLWADPQRDGSHGTQRRGALHAATLWFPYTSRGVLLGVFANILVSFTGTFADILEFISKFTSILVNSLVIDQFICNILPWNNLTRLPIFFRGSSDRGSTRSR